MGIAIEMAGEKAKTFGPNLGCPEILEYCGGRWVRMMDLTCKNGVWYTTNWGMNNSGYDLDMGQIGHSRFLSREFSCSSLAGVFHSEKEKRSPR